MKQTTNEPSLSGYKEGVSNEGPMFMPTWRLTRGRSSNCSSQSGVNKVNLGCFERPEEGLGGLGWHDRILYKEMGTSYYVVHCVGYNRLDVMNMHESTNAGVIGFFEVRSL